MKGFKDSNNKFHPINNQKGVSRKKRLDYNDPDLIENAGVKITKSRDGSNIRMKRDVCAGFLEDSASHRGEGADHSNQIMYSLGDENCASVLTDEEFSQILTNDQVANTFSPIGETYERWQSDEAFRERILDRALELIKERDGT